jgi:hypothetical protein
MSSHNEDFSLVWTERNGLQRMPGSTDLAPYREAGDTIVPEHLARLAGEMKEALELALSEFDENYDASCEPGESWQGGAHLDTQFGERLRALLAKANGGASDE